jgi:hypothetical protein
MSLRRLSCVALASAVATVVFARSAWSQEVLWTEYGLGGDLLGNSCSGGYDLDQDGVPDVVTGGIQNSGHGVVQVYSGRDGHLVFELLGDKYGDHFGSSVAMFPDLDGDGCAEFLVGASLNDWKATDAGSAYLYSGKDAKLLKSFHGALSNGHFGDHVAVAGDLNGDGKPEIAVAAPRDWTVGQDVGAVFVYSGSDYSLIRTIYGPNVRQPFFGSGLSSAGDVDADGLPDLLIGAPFDSTAGDRAGSASVYSGADGHLLWSFLGRQVVSQFGSAVSNCGDVDQDSHGDFLISAFAEDGSNTDTGHVYLYSGATGTVLRDYTGTFFHQQLGGHMADAGDLNDDGWDDYLLGDNSTTYGTDTGAASIYSGRSGRLLYRLDGVAAGDLFGTGMTRAGDLDGDGLPDLVVGAPNNDGDGTSSGSTSAFRGSSLYLQIDPDSVAANATVICNLRGGEPNGIGLIAVVAVDDDPYYETILYTALDPNGEVTLVDTAPTGMSGVTLSFQAFADVVATPAPPLTSGLETLLFK